MKYLLMILFVFLTACQSETPAENPSEETGAAAVSTDAVAVTIEGKVLGIASISGTGRKAKVTADRISLALAEKDNPLKLNLEVMDAGILARGSASYVLPLADKGDVSIDLSFIDSSRRGLSMKQRVQFSEGSIEIRSVTANSLQMVFKGTGHALMDQKKFPIEGSVNITF
jgi:hypothetical protein